MSPVSASRQAPSCVRVPAVVVGTVMSFSPAGSSPQADELSSDLREVRERLESAASAIRDETRRRFEALSRRWREETRWCSSTTEIAIHPAYQAIIGIGSAALPMILTELRRGADYWFWALKAISNEDPVPPADRGDVARMRAAWLNWGVKKGADRG